ncbi:MAG: hypothetical protein AABZ44_00190 [Elusimicrobiota bacterium]
MRYIFAAMTVILSTHAYAGMFPSAPFTQKARGQAAAAFLKIPTSARRASLGGSLSLAIADPAAVFQSPAAAATTDNNTLALTSSFLPEDMTQACVAGAVNTGSKRFLYGINALQQAPITLYNAFGTSDGSFSPLDYEVMFGIATKGQAAPAAATVNFLQTKIGPGLSGTSASADLSIGFPFGYFMDPNTSMSLALLNVGPSMKIGSKNFPLPLRAQLQGGYKLTDTYFIGADVVLPVDQEPFLVGSLEWKIPFAQEGTKMIETLPGLSIRTAITSQNRTDDFTDKLSFGIGLQVGSMSLDVGAAPFGNLGLFPRLSLNLYF